MYDARYTMLLRYFLLLFCFKCTCVKSKSTVMPVRCQVWKFRRNTSQLAIACSKLTTETLEQGVKYVQS